MMVHLFLLLGLVWLLVITDGGVICKSPNGNRRLITGFLVDADKAQATLLALEEDAVRLEELRQRLLKQPAWHPRRAGILSEIDEVMEEVTARSLATKMALGMGGSPPAEFWMAREPVAYRFLTDDRMMPTVLLDVHGRPQARAREMRSNFYVLR